MGKPLDKIYAELSSSHLGFRCIRLCYRILNGSMLNSGPLSMDWMDPTESIRRGLSAAPEEYKELVGTNGEEKDHRALLNDMAH